VSTSLIYRSAAGYELLMRVLYGRHYGARMRAVAEHVPAGASVLELCPGPGALYERHLRARAGTYMVVDVNPQFVQRLRRLGARGLVLDLASSPERLPDADIVIMQASLYHFLPDASTIVDRMLAAAREQVIIAEPIRNLASSGVPLIARLGQRAADPGTADGAAHRFSEATLDRLMDRYARQTVTSLTIPGGREKLYVLDPRRA
jgi:hypothetical protein